MGARQRRFIEAYPDVHREVHEAFPEFDYHNPAGDRSVALTYSHPENKVGHQQRAFCLWWATELCGPLDLGLDLGSHRGLTPLCVHVDKLYDGVHEHLFYGGVASADVVQDATVLSALPPNTFPLIVSSHSIEHMPAPGDDGIVAVLELWLSKLRPGGVLAMIVPDGAYWDVMGSDKDHKPGPWHHGDFRPRVLDKFLQRTGVQLLQFDTLGNRFSFDVVVRKS